MSALTITLMAFGWTLAVTFAALYFATDAKLGDCERALGRAKAKNLGAGDTPVYHEAVGDWAGERALLLDHRRG